MDEFKSRPKKKAQYTKCPGSQWSLKGDLSEAHLLASRIQYLKNEIFKLDQSLPYLPTVQEREQAAIKSLNLGFELFELVNKK
jgi:hypothetical protein